MAATSMTNMRTNTPLNKSNNKNNNNKTENRTNNSNNNSYHRHRVHSSNSMNHSHSPSNSLSSSFISSSPRRSHLSNHSIHHSSHSPSSSSSPTTPTPTPSSYSSSSGSKLDQLRQELSHYRFPHFNGISAFPLLTDHYDDDSPPLPSSSSSPRSSSSNNPNRMKPRILLFGEYGDGKTTSIGTLERILSQKNYSTVVPHSGALEGSMLLEPYLDRFHFQFVDCRGLHIFDDHEFQSIRNVIDGKHQLGTYFNPQELLKEESEEIRMNYVHRDNNNNTNNNNRNQRLMNEREESVERLISDVHDRYRSEEWNEYMKKKVQDENRMHAICFVIKANSVRWNDEWFLTELKMFFHEMKKKGMEPLILITHRDKLMEGVAHRIKAQLRSSNDETESCNSEIEERNEMEDRRNEKTLENESKTFDNNNNNNNNNNNENKDSDEDEDNDTDDNESSHSQNFVFIDEDFNNNEENEAQSSLITLKDNNNNNNNTENRTHDSSHQNNEETNNNNNEKKTREQLENERIESLINEKTEEEWLSQLLKDAQAYTGCAPCNVFCVANYINEDVPPNEETDENMLKFLRQSLISAERFLKNHQHVEWQERKKIKIERQRQKEKEKEEKEREREIQNRKRNENRFRNGSKWNCVIM